MKTSNIIAVVLSVLETYIFVGIFYAWPDINKLFKDEGVFSSKCEIHVPPTVDYDQGTASAPEITTPKVFTQWDDINVVTENTGQLVPDSFTEYANIEVETTTVYITEPVGWVTTEQTDVLPFESVTISSVISSDGDDLIEEDVYREVAPSDEKLDIDSEDIESTTGRISAAPSSVAALITPATVNEITISNSENMTEDNLLPSHQIRKRDIPFYLPIGVHQPSEFKQDIKELPPILKPTETNQNQPRRNCTAQDEEFERIFQLGYTVGMVLSFPVGMMLDL